MFDLSANSVCHPRALGNIKFQQILLSRDSKLPVFVSRHSGVSLVVDLSLGPISPHHAAREIARQLGLTLTINPILLNGLKNSVQKSVPDIVAALIDAETSGYQPITTALMHSAQVIRHLGKADTPLQVVVLTPSFGGLGEENCWFLQYLAEQLGSRFGLVGVGPCVPDLPEHWTVETREEGGTPEAFSLVVPAHVAPGLLSRVDAEELADGKPEELGLIPLQQGLYLVPPSARHAVPDADRPGLMRQIATQAKDQWLRGFALSQVGGDGDVLGLIALGWQALGEGSYFVALKIFDAIGVRITNPLTSAQIEIMRQGLRIGLEDFVGAAKASDPSPQLPPKIRGKLFQQKGWALVMSGKAAAARPYFDRALELLQTEPPSREYLYLMNISALARFRTGDETGALAVEKEIASHLAKAPVPDPYISYINNMNTARIYLRWCQPDEADLLFTRAFKWTDGLRSLADHITFHVYRARLAELRRQPALVQRHWLRAALYWVSSPMPESVSLRTARLFLNYNVPPRHRWVEDISDVLIKRLLSLFPLADMLIDTQPTFITADCLPPGICHAVGTLDASVLTSAVEIPPFQDSPSYRQLRAVLRGILHEDLLAAGLEDAPTLAVDDRGGRDMAETPAELIDTALRFGAETAWFGRQSIYHHGSQAPEVNFQIGAGVAALSFENDPAQVKFTRYRPPLDLSSLDARLLKAISNGNRALRDLATALSQRPDYLLQQARKLERNCALHLEVNL